MFLGKKVFFEDDLIYISFEQRSGKKRDEVSFEKREMKLVLMERFSFDSKTGKW